MPRKKSIVLKSKSPHPPFRDMIISAISKAGKSTKDCSNSSSLQSIVEFLKDNYQMQSDCELQVKRALGKLLKKGTVVQTEENYKIGDSAHRGTVKSDYFTLPRKCKAQDYRHVSLTNRSGIKVSGKVPSNDIREFKPIAIVSASKRVAVEVTRLERLPINFESTKAKVVQDQVSRESAHVEPMKGKNDGLKHFECHQNDVGCLGKEIDGVLTTASDTKERS